MAELVDAQVLETCIERCVGSTPTRCTIHIPNGYEERTASYATAVICCDGAIGRHSGLK